jgi:polysaccharide pyruvyl transferase WcaK-like protein
MKILHIASFLGNIGDNFNHLGIRKLLQEKLGKIEWDEIEIRETFRKKYVFDEKFADYCNTFDAVIFGGGNFFELWVDYSVNNTSANIPFDVVDKITVPFYFYALGVDPGMGVTEEGIKKFIKWTEHVNSKDNFHLSTRNDGAFDTLQKYFPAGFENFFSHLVDGGFLVDTCDIVSGNESTKTNYIGINIAGDMLDIRFNGELSYEEFIIVFTESLNSILDKNEDYNILLIPHIFSDYNVIFDILNSVEDTFRRERIDVSGLSQGVNGMINTVNSYNKCSIILGNRFHSNVIGLVLDKKVFGLFNYRQIRDLYKELNQNNYFDIRTNEGLTSLFESVQQTINNSNIPASINQEYLALNREKTLCFYEDLWR